MAKADDFNQAQLAAGVLRIEHITELVTHWQETHAGLDIDGKAGLGQTIPSIIAAIQARTPPSMSSDDVMVDEAGWLLGPKVTRVEMHQSWYGGSLARARPLGIVAHYTATSPGTAMNMARRRARMFGTDPADRLASWHITIETNGDVVAMVRLSRKAWHAGSSTAHDVPGIGSANSNTVGVELVGFGDAFPEAQVRSACEVWRAIVRRYGIPRPHAMITHQSIDPTRRSDPGPVWLAQHAQRVLDFAYQ